MSCACDRFAVPMVGGHSNQQSPYQALSVAVLGVAQGPVLSARLASPGDELWLVVNRSGSFYRHYPFWDAATKANPGCFALISACCRPSRPMASFTLPRT